jgi:hypothetical protein
MKMTAPQCVFTLELGFGGRTLRRLEPTALVIDHFFIGPPGEDLFIS